MSFTQMLLEYSNNVGKGTPIASEEKKKSMSAIRAASIRKAHKIHTDKAIAKYKAALEGRGWVPTSNVESSVGCASTAANGFLKKLLNDLGLIERRPRGGGKYNNRAGWEWRWKQEK